MIVCIRTMNIGQIVMVTLGSTVLFIHHFLKRKSLILSMTINSDMQVKGRMGKMGEAVYSKVKEEETERQIVLVYVIIIIINE